MPRRWAQSESNIERPQSDQFQIWPAIGAGLIAGAVLLIVPRGSPWSAFTFLAPVIMGRIVPPTFGLPLPATWVVHLCLSAVYGLIISAVIARLHKERAILTGAVAGFFLYLLNSAAVAVFWPDWRDSAFAVAFTHAVFGLICAGAYRGLQRRRPESEQVHIADVE